jgi:hypothetical protein
MKNCQCWNFGVYQGEVYDWVVLQIQWSGAPQNLKYLESIHITHEGSKQLSKTLMK